MALDGLHFLGIYHDLNESRLYNLELVSNNNAKRFSRFPRTQRNLFFFSFCFSPLIKDALSLSR